MKKSFIIACLIALIAPAFAGPSSAWAATKKSSSEIEALVSSIALYPDTLLKDILPASTFPDQITDAALLIQNKSDADLIKEQSWDPSVKVIANYPGVLKMMYSKLQWTTQLGDAFLNQHEDLLDAIQKLRKKAQKAGNLESDAKQEVTTQKTSEGNTVIVIQPSNPEVVYVPQYQTTAVYSEPVNTTDYVTPLVTFGLGMALGSAMSDDDDNHYYYGGYGGGAMWSGSSYNDWADVRRARNEDIHDRVMDRQDFRQDQAKSRQDFRQDYAKNNPGSFNKENINKDNLNQAKANRTASREQARTASTASRDQAKARFNSSTVASSTRSSSAFSNMNRGSYSSQSASRGASSRYSSGSFGGSGYRGGGGSRGGGGFRGGGGGGRRR